MWRMNTSEVQSFAYIMNGLATKCYMAKYEAIGLLLSEGGS